MFFTTTQSLWLNFLYSAKYECKDKFVPSKKLDRREKSIILPDSSFPPNT